MILVAGGAGYLGSHVSVRLGDQCVVYDNLTYQDEFLSNVPFVNADVTDYETLKLWLDKSIAVVWLAAIVGDAACGISPGRAMAVNVDAVQFLADNFNGPIIFTSTASVYGINEGESAEESSLNPQSLYAETKARAEEILTGRAVILRLGTLHGVSDRMRFDLAVNAMTRDAVLRGQINVFGGGQRRPLLHVADAAEHIGMWCKIWPPPGIYNFASENVSVDEIARRVQKGVFGSEVVRRGSGFEDRRDYIMNCGKIKPYLSASVRMRPVEESVREIAGMLRSGRLKNPYAHKYINAKVLQGWMINRD